jgi:hypothetical protein
VIDVRSEGKRVREGYKEVCIEIREGKSSRGL